MQRANRPDTETVIGSDNFLMVNAHVGHNCIVGSHIIIANGVLLAGHVEVGDRAFISGNCLVHQFCRIGTLALMQGGAAISQDLPPFAVAVRGNEMCGLNFIGLRRAGYTVEQRSELKRLYRALFRSGKNLRTALAEGQKKFATPAARVMLDFVAEARRGVCSDTGGTMENNQDE